MARREGVRCNRGTPARSFSRSLLRSTRNAIRTQDAPERPVTLNVERVPPDAGAEWDAFALGQPGWTPYHLHAWRRIIGGMHGHECIYLAARISGGTIRGVLPLVRVRSAL